MSSITIILHSPGKARIPFTVSAVNISLQDVPAQIKQVLTKERHQITSDLHLGHGASINHHSFFVIQETKHKYHVLAVPSTDDEISSYEILYNRAQDLYADIFKRDLHSDRVRVSKFDGELAELHRDADFPCGTFFILESQEEETKLPPLQSHKTGDNTLSNLSVDMNEHLVLGIPAREEKNNNVFDVPAPLLSTEGKCKGFLKTNEQVPENGVYSKMVESLSMSRPHNAAVKETMGREMSAYELRQVQLLEHACNGFCIDQSICQKEHIMPSFIEEMELMKKKLQDRESMTSLSQYIDFHAVRCPGNDCAIPGCSTRRSYASSLGPSKSDNLSIPQFDAINRQQHQQTIGDISVDSRIAFYSDTPSDDHKETRQSDTPPEDQREKHYQYGIPSVVTTEKASNHVFHHSSDKDRLRQTFEQEGRRNGIGIAQSFQNTSSVYSVLRSGTCIYSRDECLTEGFAYALPERGIRLGKGGNGRVSAHVINKKVFAVKRTDYRSKELNSWIKLDHKNVIPLLAVTIDPKENVCYQFMPKMKGSLKSILSSGNLEQLSQSVSEEDWKVISKNIWYILRNVLEGLKCLESHKMQHCDVKADNVLIGDCSCGKILDCSCESAKFHVYLADFDSMKETLLPRKPAALPPAQFVSQNVMPKIMGTPGYRAPELFSVLKYSNPMYEKTIMDGHIQAYTEQNCGGPWCDIWSFGVMTARICLGKPESFIRDANYILRNPSAPFAVTPVNENVHAFVTLYQLAVAALEDKNLKPFALLAKWCLELRYDERPDANQLLVYLDTNYH